MKVRWIFLFKEFVLLFSIFEIKKIKYIFRKRERERLGHISTFWANWLGVKGFVHTIHSSPPPPPPAAERTSIGSAVLYYYKERNADGEEATTTTATKKKN